MDILELTYNYILDMEIVSQETMDVVTNINGYNIETLNDILYVTTGYHDLEQYSEYEDIDFYKENFLEDKVVE